MNVVRHRVTVYRHGRLIVVIFLRNILRIRYTGQIVVRPIQQIIREAITAVRNIVVIRMPLIQRRNAVQSLRIWAVGIHGRTETATVSEMHISYLVVKIMEYVQTVVQSAVKRVRVTYMIFQDVVRIQQYIRDYLRIIRC